MKKISETFLEFIEPLLEVFEDPAPQSLNHDAACSLGHVVWNAVTLQTLNPGADHLRPARAQIGDMPELNALFDRMAERKRELFGDDNRIIGVYDIVKKPDGSFSLVAEIIQPDSVN